MVRKTLLSTLQKQKLPDAEAKLAEQTLSDILDVVEKTVEGKKIDVAAMAILEPDAATLAVAATIADGAKLDKALLSNWWTRSNKRMPRLPSR